MQKLSRCVISVPITKARDRGNMTWTASTSCVIALEELITEMPKVAASGTVTAMKNIGLNTPRKMEFIVDTLMTGGI